MEASSRYASFGEGVVEWGQLCLPRLPLIRLLPHIETRFPNRWGLQLVNANRSAPELRAGRLPVHLGSFFLRR
jgi:hypothetical protein